MKKYFIIMTLIFFIHPAFALRIISLSPNITDMLFAIGAGSQIIATDFASDTPNAVRELPKVADYQQIDVEKIIALHPDVVIASRVIAQQQQLQQLQKFKIIVYYLEPKQLTDVASNLQQLGQWTGHQQVANQLAINYLKNLKKLRQQYQHKKPITVFYEVWQWPLLTVNNQSVVGQIIGLCGGENIFANQKNMATGVSLESVIAKHPEVIIVTNSAKQIFWQQWLPSSKIIILSADQSQRYTPNILRVATELCKQLRA